MSKNRLFRVTDGAVECYIVAEGADDALRIADNETHDYFEREGEWGSPLSAKVLPDDKMFTLADDAAGPKKKTCAEWARTEPIGPLAFSEY